MTYARAPEQAPASFPGLDARAGFRPSGAANGTVASQAADRGADIGGADVGVGLCRESLASGTPAQPPVLPPVLPPAQPGLDLGATSDTAPAGGDFLTSADLSLTGHVDIPDAALRRAVEQALGKRVDQPISPVDMAGLTSLTARGAGIADLSGLELAVRLEHLDLYGNDVSDITPLAGLSSLEMLSLAHNRIRDDAFPTLSQLTGLEVLSLAGNVLDDLSQWQFDFPRLRVLDLASTSVDGNDLTGRLPLSLTWTSLSEFRYSGTDLCMPGEEAFSAWLNTVPTHEGTGSECAPLSDLDILEALYRATDGPNWDNWDGWLTDAPLAAWYGVETDATGSVTSVNLYGNQLTGQIPPEVGNLARLEYLAFSYNRLVGEIPPELGTLTSLTWLSFYGNALTSSIPPELGNLASLQDLYVPENKLTGSIPPELGNLANLQQMTVSSNNLTGLIPPEIGRMSSLQKMDLSHNSGMEGAVPVELTTLRNLEELLAAGTGLCAPTDPDFQTWLVRVHKARIMACRVGELPAAYLTQAVQSREFPVPLVAGEKALLRVFPTAGRATSAGIPAMRARFYRDGRETHVVDLPGKSTPIPAEVDEGSFATSASVEIAGDVLQPGLEMVIEIDPDGTLDAELGVPRRIPEEGRMAVDVRAMPLFDLTLIPYVWNETDDASIVDLIEAMAAEPDSHEMLEDTRTLLPVGELAVTAHALVRVDSNDSFELLSTTEMIRAMEGGQGHYMGLMNEPVTGSSGVALLPGRVSFSVPGSEIMAHELGHNLRLHHAPCDAGDPDSAFPYVDGTIGAWGYDFRAGRLVQPDTFDLMSYCGERWISDYHFTNALRYRIADSIENAASVARPARALMLWGGVGVEGVPFLEPSFVVDAAPVLPEIGGDYRLSGRSADGRVLFDLTFDMRPIADGDGSSSFAFVLPAQPVWAGDLVSITLTGPGGSAMLDGNSNRPISILRNPRTGQVRGVLRDLPLDESAPANGAEQQAAGFEALFSRGIPDVAVWRR